MYFYAHDANRFTEHNAYNVPRLSLVIFPYCTNDSVAKI